MPALPGRVLVLLYQRASLVCSNQTEQERNSQFHLTRAEMPVTAGANRQIQLWPSIPKGHQSRTTGLRARREIESTASESRRTGTMGLRARRRLIAQIRRAVLPVPTNGCTLPRYQRLAGIGRPGLSESFAPALHPFRAGSSPCWARLRLFHLDQNQVTCCVE